MSSHYGKSVLKTPFLSYFLFYCHFEIKNGIKTKFLFEVEMLFLSDFLFEKINDAFLFEIKRFVFF